MKKKGFTLIELCLVIAIFGILFVVFLLQKTSVDAMQRDEARKTAVNAMYYALEEGYYKINGYYPTSISADNLKMVDPKLFTDPSGVLMGESGCDYIYIPANCDSEGKCQAYIIRSRLEKEDIYIKRNRIHNV